MCLGGAAILIKAIEFDRQLARSCCVAGQQQINHVIRNIHAAGGVDAWR